MLDEEEEEEECAEGGEGEVGSGWGDMVAAVSRGEKGGGKGKEKKGWDVDTKQVGSPFLDID